MKLTIIAVCLIGLAGCTPLQSAGSASYTIKPFAQPDGNLACCEVEVLNGKEIANLEAKIVKKGDDFTVELKEQGVVAFKGQEIAAEATKAIVADAVKAALIAAGVVIP